MSLILHAHLPFVRHPEQERFFEESWLFEALTGCYIPLARLIASWEHARLAAPFSLTLSPTLCEMLADPLLQKRLHTRLKALVELSKNEIERTFLESQFHDLAWMYHQRFASQLDYFERIGGNLLHVFKEYQDRGLIELLTTAATHAILPLLLNHPGCLHAQLMAARATHERFFKQPPSGIWLPECAYEPRLDCPLARAGFRWFVVESHGLALATPQAFRGISAPVLTRNGLAVFGRDPESAHQVWSRESGYPGDPRYRDFYRDAGYDLEFDYVSRCFPHPHERGFTGIKYHAISRHGQEKQIYHRDSALHAASTHAEHFVRCRKAAIKSAMVKGLAPPLLTCPYDAELFGHWWFEGPEFLNALAREIHRTEGELKLITPSSYLTRHPTHQVSTPAASTWGESGHLKVWINERNSWMRPHLEAAQARMEKLANTFERPSGQQFKALQRAGRELLLAQSSDWPFMLRNQHAAIYATQRFNTHIQNFNRIHDQLTSDAVPESDLAPTDPIPFPELDPQCWNIAHPPIGSR